LFSSVFLGFQKPVLIETWIRAERRCRTNKIPAASWLWLSFYTTSMSESAQQNTSIASEPIPPPGNGQVHEEKHFESSAIVRDIVIGLSDGLTVPFALAAGLSGAVASSRIVVLAGLAEIAAGSIAMGLGGYLAARGDAEHYASEKEREQREVVERTHDEEEEIYEIFERYSVPRTSAAPVLEALRRNPSAWVDFMMRFELGLEEPPPGRAHRSALTIASSYIAGGLIPLVPYMLIVENGPALQLSVVITLLALAIFGALKGRIVGTGWLRSAIQTVLIGGIAAAVAYLLARLLNQHA
jgi:VIT1/CCC1 family predicted Fe2+/Mn2+ transporter